ncbi:molybdenum cofactor guanylyltransferase [Paenibacillus sp. NPDC056579]|uniref:molybdenum cofactor guanylyltransferase n=1 Tax=Paenibacillus sp. NPDC056579 TaxID=3345871 RepID=UPI0036ADC080
MVNGIVKPMTGVVLAGGQNRRMGGRMKALLPMDGRLFIERQLEELAKVCGDIWIAVSEHAPFERWLTQEQPGLPSGVPVRAVRDMHPGSGPLAGLQAAMAAAQAETLWVVACDMPFVSADAARAMAQLLHARESADAVVPVIGGKVHPLHAVYRRRCGKVVDELLEQGQYRVMELLRRLNYTAAEEEFFSSQGISPRFAVNVNGPDDYEKLQRQTDESGV